MKTSREHFNFYLEIYEITRRESQRGTSVMVDGHITGEVKTGCPQPDGSSPYRPGTGCAKK